MELVSDILRELDRVAVGIDQNQADMLCKEVLNAKRIYLTGRGRSGLIARMFAMRLMHMGLEVYVVDEVVTPSISEKDLLIICSGSGETGSLKAIADKAKKIGAKIILITANDISYIAQKADGFILIRGYTPKNKDNQNESIQPMGAQFEQLLLMVLESVVVMLKKELGISEEEMMKRHANLE